MEESKENENNNFMIDLIEERRTDKKFYRRIIIFLICVILVQGLYHTYKWSEFDTVVVDSEDGGNANYIGNDGDITNGASGSTQEKEKQEQ